MFERLARWPIRRQILTIAALPILAVCALALAFYQWEPEDTELAQAELAAAQIALVVDQVENAGSPELAEGVLAATRSAGLPVEWIDPGLRFVAGAWAFEDRVLYALSNIYGRSARAIEGGDVHPLIVVETAGGLLAFAPTAVPVPNALNDFILLQATVIVLLLILLSSYAARAVTAPLTRLAKAAQAQDSADPSAGAFPEAGPQEIRTLGARLNEMRGQIRAMLDQRTAMLRAVSHDLRTPLTRLKLRVERSVPEETAGVLLRDIASINDMIDETLTYLRADHEHEPVRRVDLPSLLRTISTDFSDIGHAVSYSGPDRLTFACRARALARAVSNLVDNGTKYGETVEINLRALPDGAVRIEVSDDGKGMPEAMRTKVLEPFVKADWSRSEMPGFGLGLSIVEEVARRHGGTLTLGARVPNGLAATVVLPAG